MRNLSTGSWAPPDMTKRGSTAGLAGPANQQHAKYKGLISTAGYCKFSAWKRETDIPRQPFSKLILSSLASQSPERYKHRSASFCMKKCDLGNPSKKGVENSTLGSKDKDAER